ncbi:MAG: glycosyltransferase family 9 protein, partial [Candidatus Poribacteria bacterium]
MKPSIKTAEEKKPIRCLVIQLARLGDTLQSLMALKAAKQLYPNLELHFLVRERFSAAAKRIPWIEKIITFPTTRLLGPLFTGEKTESESFMDLAKWVSPIKAQSWDLIANWSYSESSSFLAALLPAKIKLGYSRRKDASFFCSDDWSYYVNAIIQGKIPQNIHLTDVLTTQLLTALQIHVGPPQESGNMPVTARDFFSPNQSQSIPLWQPNERIRKWIAIQLGASRHDKTWPPEYWARMAHAIMKRNSDYRFVLLGGTEDRSREKIFMKELSRLDSDTSKVLSLIDKTDFDTWAEVIGSCNWLFSGDTAAIHLASVLGTRVFNVSVGPVKLPETGPYGNGHYIISSN